MPHLVKLDVAHYRVSKFQLGMNVLIKGAASQQTKHFNYLSAASPT